MILETQSVETHRQTAWPWRTAVVIETPALVSGISEALEEMGATCAFRATPSMSALELANLVERERPDLLFVELASVAGPVADWIAKIRGGSDAPLIVAVHSHPDPEKMIEAMRGGASEFLCLPVRPGIFEAMDRTATMLEARQLATVEKGRLLGILSAKGGCGATSLACHLSAAILGARTSARVLVADLDQQSPSAHRVLRTSPRKDVGAAFENVRRLNLGSWSDYVATAAGGVELLGAVQPGNSAVIPEPWRIESLFRFLTRHYSWVLADLGRHLNPANWVYLQNIDELFVVTAPDVLALYQTRSILQTLTGRGFDKSRIRLILNRNQMSPQDFWIESIEQMFEMGVTAVIPNDYSTMSKISREAFEFPANSPFGKAVAKLAGRVMKPGGGDSSRKAA
ncbi:MAG TPA: hypothetical protein VHB50_15200 [Bryobacteraceae bacterium]|nr:hypothetical protein [Bryobacteraceae bacterium]